MIRSAFRLLAALLVLTVLPTVASAQSAQSVVDAMKARYQEQLETVETYILQTNLHTTYHKRVESNGDLHYKTATRMTGSSGTPMQGFGEVSTPAQIDHLDRLATEARYVGTETVNGTRCHVLVVDDPSAVDPEFGENLTSMTYYVDAEQHVPIRYEAELSSSGEGPTPKSMTITFSDYRTVDGLTVPFRTEIQTNVAESLSDEQRKQIQKLQEQLEQLPEAQREQMKKMMGEEQLKQLQAMMSGKPSVIEVQDVKVNVPLPEDVFSGS